MTPGPGEVTQLLHKWRSGDREAEGRLFELLLPDLRTIAGRCFRAERPGHTLQPTALVNEAFLRLAKSKNIDWQDRGHFLAVSARVMRRLLIDHARTRPSVRFLPMEGLPERVLSTRTPLEIDQKAIDRAPGLYGAYTNLGAALDELGRDAEAEKALLTSLNLHPTPRALNSMGAIRAYQKRDEEAVSFYTQAINLDRSEYPYLINLADSNRRLGRAQEAKAGYLEAMNMALAALT